MKIEKCKLKTGDRPWISRSVRFNRRERGAAFGRNQIRATDQTRMKHGLLTGANGENGKKIGDKKIAGLTIAGLPRYQGSHRLTAEGAENAENCALSAFLCALCGSYFVSFFCVVTFLRFDMFARVDRFFRFVRRGGK